MTTYANPGAIGDVVTATSIETTWGNAIRDRVIQNFASTAARDAAITVPVLGMHCYVAGVGLQQYAGATAGWQKPWYQPWGQVAIAVVTAATSTAGGALAVDIAGMSVTWIAVANRFYRFTLFTRVQSTIAGDRITVQITDSANTVQCQCDSIADTVSVHQSQDLFLENGSIAAGSHTFKGRILRGAGTGTVAAQASAVLIGYLLVDDVGPNGDPP